MRIDIITLFPQFFEPILNGSILRRAQAREAVEFRLHDLWKFVPAGERADDAPYGGGAGMVMRLGPLITCLENLLGTDLTVPQNCCVLVPSPAGEPFSQKAAQQLAAYDRLIIVCGHYEGIDDRFFDLVSAREYSLGDFILTGGEIPAIAFIDAAVRLLPGVIHPESAVSDSFQTASLDWPHYTRPAVFRGVAVPDVLLSGDHERIARWRREAAVARTQARRPDLGA